MSPTPSNEIFNSRIIPSPIEKVYEAFANPEILKKWWGPEGFTNTINEFNLLPEGKWLLTMHGPEKGNYESASVFKVIEPLQLIAWTRVSQPYFDMEVGFNKIDESNTEISFRMIFKTKEACDKIKNFAGPKNEENFNRLEKELEKL